MIIDTIRRQGSWFFRWRSYVLLGFAPLLFLVVSKPEPIELHFGQMFDSVYESLCLVLAFIGLGLRMYCVGHVPSGTSGRNTEQQVAATLNTTGLYSLTRNPLYFANSVIYMAFALFTQDIFFIAAMGLFLIIYLERIIAAEEAFLTGRFGAAYLDWAAATPAFFPKLGGWVAPLLPFSWRTALKREYSGFFAIFVAFFVLDQSRELMTRSTDRFDGYWVAALATSAVVYLLLMGMKKHTSLLAVDGR